MAHIHVHTYIIAKSSQKLSSVKQTENENISFLLTVPAVTHCLLVHQRCVEAQTDSQPNVDSGVISAPGKTSKRVVGIE